MTLLFYARDIGTNCVRGEASKLYKRDSAFHGGTRPEPRPSCIIIDRQVGQANILTNQRLGDLKQRFPARNNTTANEGLIHLRPIPSVRCESLGRMSVEHDTAYEAKVAKMSCGDLGSEAFIAGRLHTIHPYPSTIVLKVGNRGATGAIFLNQVVKASKRIVIEQSIVVAEQKAIASVS